MGIAQASIDFLAPTKLAKSPKHNVPKIAPTDNIEPIHPASLFVTFPVTRGESFDRRIGSEGDSQPTPQPWPKQTILAKNYKLKI